MIDFNKNELINETLDKYYETFSHTLDTAEYVPEKFNKKILQYIYKNMRKSFRQIEKEDAKFQRNLKKIRSPKTKFKDKLKLLFKRLFSRNKRSDVVKDKADYFLEQKINECDSASALDKRTSDLNSTDTNPKQ